MFAAIAAIVAVVLSVGVAAADTRLAPLDPMPASAQAEAHDTHDVGMALIIPTVAMGASVVLLKLGDDRESEAYSTMGVVGMALAPSLGHVYTGDWRGVAIGTGLRVAGGAALIAGLSRSENYDAYSSEESSGGEALALVGVAGMLGGTLYSLIDAPFSAQRKNEKARRVSLIPAPIQGPNQSTGWGAQMAMTF